MSMNQPMMGGNRLIHWHTMDAGERVSPLLDPISRLARRDVRSIKRAMNEVAEIRTPKPLLTLIQRAVYPGQVQRAPH